MPSCYRHRKLGIPPVRSFSDRTSFGTSKHNLYNRELAKAATSDDFNVLTAIDAAMRTVVAPDMEPLKTSLR